MYKLQQKETCPLCGSLANPFHKDEFFKCGNCRGIFRSKDSLLSPTEEKRRYENHNNDVNDSGYRAFVSPIVDAVMKSFTTDSLGLDFGSGTGPATSKMLQENGYVIKQYDPFFQNDVNVLNLKYDYIVSCEVIEHFHNPAKEFKLLKSLLRPNGHLFCMTLIYDESIDFSDWYYKNDPTHVFFYQEKTLEWVKENFGFSGLSIEGRLIELKV